MKLIQDNYLDQMTEELEIINWRLDRLFQESIIDAPVSNDTDEFSLFESIDDDPQINIDFDKYEVYSEALADTLKNIWKMIIRFVKSVFVSSGQRFTTADAKKVVEILDGADANELAGARMKMIVQKGFYMIAGLGSSIEAVNLKRAYDSGDIVNFVTSNIHRVKVDKLPPDASFRICIASYEENMKTSKALTKATLDILSKDGIKGIKEIGEKGNKKIKKLKAEGIEYDIDTLFEDIMYEEVPLLPQNTQTSIQSMYGSSGGSGEVDVEALAKQAEEDKQKKAAEAAAAKRKEEVHAQQVENGKRLGKQSQIVSMFKKDPWGMAKELVNLQKNHASLQEKYAALEEAYNSTRLAAASQFKDLKEAKAALELSKKECVALESIINDLQASGDVDAKEINTLKEALARMSKDNQNLQAAVDNMADVGNSSIPSQYASDAAKSFMNTQSSLQKALNTIKSAASSITKGLAAGAVAVGGLIIGLAYLGSKATGQPEDKLSMVVVTYVNENSDNAMARFRLYTHGVPTPIDIKGKEKVSQVKNDLVAVAEEMSVQGDKLGNGTREKVNEFAQNILTVFSGLASRGK